jgi:hypothetical protein
VVQVITPEDRISRNQFAVTMLERLDEDNEFLRKIMFSDETKFHRFRDGEQTKCTHLGI